MKLVPLRLSAACLLLASALFAQTPSDRPPWWGVVDDVTVSLFWDFAGGSLTPTSVVAPSWYDPNVTAGLLSGAAAPIPVLAGQTDVIGVVGNGSPRAGALTMTVDNDSHIGWVKVFFFQFDVFEGASGAVVERLVQDLQKYDRSAVEWRSEPLLNGWQRVTVQAQLYPQPDDETLAWSFVENAFGTVAIDNLFVNSKCVKVDESDQDGLAMGTTVLGPIDLSALTAQSDCVAVAVTEGPAPAFARTLFVGVRAPGTGAAHQLLRLQGGAVVGATPVPGVATAAPLGPVDLAVETVRSPLGHTQFVYALLDERSSAGGGVRLVAFDAQGAVVPARSVAIPAAAVPSATALTGLAFSPSGAGGAGSFVVGDQSGQAFEFDRGGGLLRTRTTFQAQGRGLGYDPVFGRFYQWSDQPLATPRGPLRTGGVEISAYDGLPTGVRFFGDLSLPTTPLGGSALGLEAYRSVASGRLRLACVVDAGGSRYYYELAAPFRYGTSFGGACGMDGLPFAGSNTLAFTLSTSRSAQFAAVYVGFSNTTNSNPPATLPFLLGPVGVPESRVLASLDLRSPLLLPTRRGFFSFQMPTIPVFLRGSPMFAQWLVFDAAAPSGVAMSRAGKILIQ